MPQTIASRREAIPICYRTWHRGLSYQSNCLSLSHANASGRTLGRAVEELGCAYGQHPGRDAGTAATAEVVDDQWDCCRKSMYFWPGHHGLPSVPSGSRAPPNACSECVHAHPRRWCPVCGGTLCTDTSVHGKIRPSRFHVEIAARHKH